MFIRKLTPFFEFSAPTSILSLFFLSLEQNIEFLSPAAPAVSVSLSVLSSVSFLLLPCHLSPSAASSGQCQPNKSKSRCKVPKSFYDGKGFSTSLPVRLLPTVCLFNSPVDRSQVHEYSIMAARSPAAATTMTSRVDVFKGKIFDFVPLRVYYARFGFFDPSSSPRCVFVLELEPQHVFSTKILDSTRIWEEYYLTEDIDYLRLDTVQFTQMVVAVDRDQKKVCRGFILALRPSAGAALLYVLDVGRLQEFPMTSLFATTELVTKTPFMGFPCVLDNLGLFDETSLLASVMNTIALGMKPNTLCKVLCKGFAPGEEKLPIVDFWPYTDETVEPLLTSKPFNMVLATACIDQWTRDLKSPQTIFGGSVTKVEPDGRVNIHVPALPDGETPAIHMEAYLKKFKLQEIERKVPCLKYTEAVKGCMAKTIYLTQYSGDEKLYRCRVLEVLNHQGALHVEFIDYGDTDTVPYSKVFDVTEIDKVLAILPPLTWQAYLFTIDTVIDEDAALNLFLDEKELNFTICAGLRKGLRLVSISGRGRDGTRYNMFQKLLAAGLIIPTK